MTLTINKLWQYGSDERIDISQQDGVAPQTKVGDLPDGQRAYIPSNWSPQGFISSHEIGNYKWIFSKNMLNLANKIASLLVIFILCTSCEKKSNIDDQVKIVSRKISGQWYDSIHNRANDSINVWANNQLYQYRAESVFPWRIDSTICFNKEFTRCVMALEAKCISKDCVQDEVRYFYGARVNNEWFFFTGSSFALPRELYQDDIHTPLSFEEMHEIAMENIFKGYLAKDDRGEWQINDKFFVSMANKNASGPGYGPCVNCKSEEEYFLYLSKENWLSQFKPLREENVKIFYEAELKKIRLRFPLRSFSEHIAPFKVVTKMYKKDGPTEPTIIYIQSISKFEETGSSGEIIFEGINLDDVLTFHIRVYFTTVIGDKTPNRWL